MAESQSNCCIFFSPFVQLFLLSIDHMPRKKAKGPRGASQASVTPKSPVEKGTSRNQSPNTQVNEPGSTPQRVESKQPASYILVEMKQWRSEHCMLQMKREMISPILLVESATV